MKELQICGSVFIHCTTQAQITVLSGGTQDLHLLAFQGKDFITPKGPALYSHNPWATALMVIDCSTGLLLGIKSPGQTLLRTSLPTSQSRPDADGRCWPCVLGCEPLP